MNALLTVVSIELLQRLNEDGQERQLRAFFLVAGVALFNHAQLFVLGEAALVAFAIRLYRLLGAHRWREALSSLGACALAGGLGLLPYGLTFARDAAHLGWSAAAASASGGQFRALMFKGDVCDGLRAIGSYLLLQLPSPFLLLLLPGLVLLARCWRRSEASAALLLILAANSVFFMFYDTWDRFAFLLPSFVVFAFAASYSVEPLRRLAMRRRSAMVAALLAVVLSLASSPYLYAHAASWSQSGGPWQRFLIREPFRNTFDFAEYVVNPNKRRYRDFTDFADALFLKLAQGAVYIDDDSRLYYTLRYPQVHEKRRPDVRILLVNVWGFEDWGVERDSMAGSSPRSIRRMAISSLCRSSRPSHSASRPCPRSFASIVSTSDTGSTS